MDTILYGKIYTMDRENPYVEAVGIKDGKIAYAGSREGIDAEKSSRVIDCKEGAAFPGFIDTHVHAVPSGPFMKGVDVSGAKDTQPLFPKEGGCLRLSFRIRI